MSTAVVVDLVRARQARADRIAAAMAMHPALRWWLASDGLAHHRAGGAAACGVPGPLAVALPGTPRCAACWG
jgi:hypothetical protein